MSEEEQKDALLTLVRVFIAKQSIHCQETIYQTDRVIENAYEFIESLCDVVGYLDEDASVKAMAIDLNPVKPLPTKWFTDDYVDAAVSKARAEALDDASRLAGSRPSWDDVGELMSAIRALKDKPANQTDGRE
jgi:hypothetical protein